jgi:hypothetical protein
MGDYIKRNEEEGLSAQREVTNMKLYYRRKRQLEKPRHG